MSLTHAHQCPRCECRFFDEPELTEHLRRDHDVDRIGHVFEHEREDPSRH